MVHVGVTITITIAIGPLAAVGDVSHDIINSSSLDIHVSWSAPYTLDGVDILGYNITITKTYFTPETHIITVNNETDPCIEQMVTISGYNGAGDGDTVSFTFYYPHGTHNTCMYMMYNNRDQRFQFSPGEFFFCFQEIPKR